jgi:antitoxin component of MazEF toxin-antitoxin module
MTIIIKSTTENSIAIPKALMKALNLHDGDEVKAVVDGETLRLAGLNKFLSLRGALANDQDFERAMESNDKAWQAWTTNESA